MADRRRRRDHKTIIKPLAGREFDADFLLQLSEQADWANHPTTYLDEVEAAFRRSPRYRDKVRRKTRCVRIVYADDCHVDVVPYLVRSDGSQVIVCRDTDDFEATNPEGFTAWMKEKDDLANGNLRRVIRLQKYLRDYKTTFSCPSVILTTLVGERVLALDADTRYPDVPTALKNLVTDLDAWLQLRPTMPSIADRVALGTTFDHRWDADKYANFRTQIHRYAEWIATAYDEPDRDASVTAWQKVFGPDFKAPVADRADRRECAYEGGSRCLVPRAPTEEFIDERFPLDVRYTATISGRVLPRAGLPAGLNPEARAAHEAARPAVQGRHERALAVRRLLEGTELRSPRRSERTGCGESWLRDPRPLEVSIKESTLYAGTHWIECYVVKDNRVLATYRHAVEIL